MRKVEHKVVQNVTVQSRTLVTDAGETKDPSCYCHGALCLPGMKTWGLSGQKGVACFKPTEAQI